MDQDHFYKRLDDHLGKELPLVVYRKPGEPSRIKALLQQNSSVYKTESFSETGFIFSPFDPGKEPIFIPRDQSEFLESSTEEDFFTDLNSVKDNSPSANKDFLKNTLPSGRPEHLSLVKKGIEALKTGEMDKVVLSRREELPLRGKHPLTLFQELVREYPSAFAYCWYHPAVGLWLGATPETLVQVKGLNFETMALAGTQKYSGTMEVFWGAKERQEQQYVTDSILDDLKETRVIEEIKTTEVYTTRAGGLLHLRTDISGRLNAAQDLRQIVEKLHPTPAVCGLPKDIARDFILQKENHDREFYTGFLGELNFQESKSRSRTRRNTENLAYVAIKKSTSLFVNLRCMKLEGDNAVLFVGGGITKDSIAEDEWQETVNKSETMKRVLEK